MPVTIEPESMDVTELAVLGEPDAVADPPAVGGVGISCSKDPVAGGSTGVTTITVKIEGVNAEGSASDLAALLKALAA